MKQYKVSSGRRFPFGATVDEKGANFSVWGLRSTAAELLLFETAQSREPFQVVRLDPAENRTYYSWHVYVEGLPAGTHYAWRLDGPGDTRRSGFRFDRQKGLIDPHARAVSDLLWDRRLASLPGDNVASSMRGIVVAGDGYDWEGDRPLDRPLEESIIYEMHVGGFTRHPSSGVKYPGTFSGVIEKIPYLRSLGVTDVELMPVMAFDEQDVPDAAKARGLRNCWGYSTHSFFSPHPGYCISPEKGTHLGEFRDMVKAFHRAGIGVIMDVVLNHTAEGGAGGPTINFKGLGNRGFYHLDPNDRSIYLDYTGCGNTVNCNFPIVTAFLIECLEYWVSEMHVDGFRFDLASVLVRGHEGRPLHYAPMPWYIELSDVLGNTRLIAEAWDAGGLYQVGDFPGFRWAEWNGRYRDVMRRFVRGDPGLIGEAATRLAGSSDLYEPEGRLPANSVNFIACHDGFTLHDLVSYNQKHNEANGEANRDGSDDNASGNCGVEGETRDPGVLALRKRQAKNFMAVLLLSQGVPMILSGDEVLRTQRGNNNCYCQDNEMGWFDWGLVEDNGEMLRFTTGMISFRKRHPSLMRRQFLTGRKGRGGLPDVAWHGPGLNEPRWDDPGARVLACTLAATDKTEEHLHIMLNMSDADVQMELPEVPGRGWYRAVDTSQPPPADVTDPAAQPGVKGYTHRVAAWSIVVLEAR
ncbi:MAG: glycogen debranching protein GlgX [Nitrospiraceae bacterium]|nr:glycogen debranching protein GlgX [Nitrospiraceae bacterium]